MNLEGEFKIHSSIKEVEALSRGMVAMRNSLQAFQSYIPAELVRQDADDRREGEVDEPGREAAEEERGV